MNMIDSNSVIYMNHLDFSKTYDKVDHGIALHKLKDFLITVNLGVWFYQFLTGRSHYVLLPGGVSNNNIYLKPNIQCI